MIVTLAHRITLILASSVLMIGLYGCSTGSAVLEQSLSDNNQLIEDLQWMLWRQGEKLDEVALSQESLESGLKDTQSHLSELKKQSEILQSQSEAQEGASSAQQGVTVQKTTHLMASVAIAKEAEKTVIGRNEWVWVDLIGKVLKARVDTGALSSALHASRIQPFERNGDKWVRFSLSEDKGTPEFEAPLVRHVRIRQASAETLDRRPVVILKVRMGDIVEETPFTLNDRNNMLYPVLLGREFLRDIVVVDVAKKFTQTKYIPVKGKAER